MTGEAGGDFDVVRLILRMKASHCVGNVYHRILEFQIGQFIVDYLRRPYNRPVCDCLAEPLSPPLFSSLLFSLSLEICMKSSHELADPFVFNNVQQYPVNHNRYLEDFWFARGLDNLVGVSEVDWEDGSAGSFGEVAVFESGASKEGSWRFKTGSF